MAAWNDWYHVTCNTYGTWLPGDPRGWRERKHKRHVSGDYKSPPPPGSGDALHRHARNLLKHAAVHLDPQQCRVAGRAVVAMLVKQAVEVIAASLDAVHFHVLARFSDQQVRPKIGRAKKHAYHELRDRGLAAGLWEEGSDVVPIRDRSHQVNVFNYICRHREEGAWVWTFREGLLVIDGEDREQ